MTRRVRRSSYVFFQVRDGDFVDVELLLRGVAERVPLRQIVALSLLTGEQCAVSAGDLELLAELPSDEWLAADFGPELRELAEDGLVLTDARDGSLAELRRREEVLASGQWHPYAALFHFLGRGQDVEIEVPDETALSLTSSADDFVGRYGPPPPHFHSLPNRRGLHELPLVTPNGALYDLLRRRQTTRVFDADVPMREEDLATLLHWTYGCHGYVAASDTVVALRRTSPSGGSLHPIEVYPLVREVEGVEPGLYHYAPAEHALELIMPMRGDEVADLAGLFTCGQSYFRSAHVLFVNTARFYRSFWKYRRHRRAYGVILMDLGHLSQTLYLVATELGLGAFITAAINGANIEEALGIDSFGEGALAVTGCGVPARRPSPLEPEFSAFVPRETQI